MQGWREESFMEKGLISIIITAYNSQKYIRRCLDSVLRQTFKNYEAIIVNDGSCDDTQSICEEYVKKDSRFHLYNKENGGSSSARNYGLSKVKGEYLTWLDSDDEYSDIYLEKLVFYLKLYNADISICDYLYLNESNLSAKPCLNEELANNTNEIKEYKTKKDMLRFLKRLYQPNGIICIVPWGKLFKTSLYSGIKFPEGKCFDDQATIYKTYLASSKIVEFASKLYYYYYNSNSISNTNYCKHPEDMFFVCEERNELFKQHNFNSLIGDTQYSYIFYLVHYLNKHDLTSESYIDGMKKLRKLAFSCLFQKVDLKHKLKCLILIVCPKIFIKRNI